MNDTLYNVINSRYSLKSLDTNEYGVIRYKGMEFTTKVYEAENIGQFFIMDMSGMLGLMKMETVVFSPVLRDGPILSADMINAFGRSTLILELYDTTISHPDFSGLNEVKEKYADVSPLKESLIKRYDLTMPLCDYKRGYGIRQQTENETEEYCERYLDLVGNCPSISSDQKKDCNAGMVRMLLSQGGPAVNQFKKMIGEQKTEVFLSKYMFASA